MNSTTMDAHRSHVPGPASSSDGRFKELAAGIGYLFAIGAAFTTVLSLALIVFVGE